MLADYVTVEDGTGLVHQSPAFGADDLAVGRRYRLPVVNPITADGHFAADVPLVGGMFFKKADATLVADLEQRGLLFRHVPYEHSYPHCWRCHTPLLYYAQLVLVHPHDRDQGPDARGERAAPTGSRRPIKTGRYGDWLNNNIDWALSRNRYWGTPLPLWRVRDDHVTVVGSLAELGSWPAATCPTWTRTGRTSTRSSSPAPSAAQQAERVPEVIDAWYDSGSMPFAQWGYPRTGVEQFESSYPAQFICEAIDQTRGWFYTLMAIGTLVFDRSSYENVVCLGHILDEEGRKMSKHLGNVLRADPADGRPRRRRRPLVHGGERLALAVPSHRAHHDPGGRPQDAAHVLEHGVVPVAVRQGRRLGPAHDAGPAGGRAPGAGPVGAVRGEPARP